MRAIGAPPIVEDPDVDAGARFGGERLGKLAPDDVVVDDVVLEQDRMLGAANGGEPGRIIFRGVLQQANGVALDRR